MPKIKYCVYRQVVSVPQTEILRLFKAQSLRCKILIFVPVRHEYVYTEHILYNSKLYEIEFKQSISSFVYYILYC